MAEESRIKLIQAINRPLGFYVLALLIVEGFLGLVLIFSDLTQNQKFIGMGFGLILFLIIITVVLVLVWCKPKNLMFGGEDHLKDNYGSENLLVSKKEIEKSKKIDINGDA